MISRINDFVTDYFTLVILAIGIVAFKVGDYNEHLIMPITFGSIGLLAWIKFMAQHRDRLIVGLLAILMTAGAVVGYFI